MILELSITDTWVRRARIAVNEQQVEALMAAFCEDQNARVAAASPEGVLRVVKLTNFNREAVRVARENDAQIDNHGRWQLEIENPPQADQDPRFQTPHWLAILTFTAADQAHLS